MLIFCTRQDRDATVSFFLCTRRDRNLALLFYKIAHPDQEETETRLSEKFSSETRRDNLQNFVWVRYETESLGTFSLETETRPRLSPISDSKKCNIWVKSHKVQSLSIIVTIYHPRLLYTSYSVSCENFADEHTMCTHINGDKRTQVTILRTKENIIFIHI